MRHKHLLSTIVLLGFLSGPVHCTDSFPQIEGWQVSSELLSFNSDNLWEHINGAADQFIDYDFVSLQTCELTREDMVISIEIYTMRSTLHAFGIYTAERPAAVERLAVGGEGVVLPPGQLLLYKDIYYVKVYAYEGEFTVDTGTNVLAGIAAALPGAGDLPSQLALLPEKFRISGSENFIGKSFLGLQELQNCIYAEYQEIADTRYQIFYILGDTTEIWQNLVNLKWQTIKIDRNQYIYRSIPYKGIVGLFVEQGYISGIAFSEDIKSIAKMRSRIK